jgi:large subunit ribosomal protein L15
MQIHQLKRNTPNKKHVQVGRGGKRGKTSGRGTKGQKARAGAKFRPEIRDMIMKIPKARGYRFKGYQEKAQGVNLNQIDGAFAGGEVVNVSSLLSLKLVNKFAGRNPRVKILGTGELSKKLNFEGVTVSSSAKEKIEKAGGSVK